MQVFVFSQELSDEEDLLPQRQVKRHPAEVPVVLSPEEVTENDIRNVAQKSGGKIYSSEHGTCCHQCRYLDIERSNTNSLFVSLFLARWKSYQRIYPCFIMS
jgi:hypothetical protein